MLAMSCAMSTMKKNCFVLTVLTRTSIKEVLNDWALYVSLIARIFTFPDFLVYCADIRHN